jgi:hypothetical protein
MKTFMRWCNPVYVFAFIAGVSIKVFVTGLDNGIDFVEENFK